MSAYAIRDACIDTDMPNIARITSPYEDQPRTADEMREWFQYNPPGRLQRRLVSVDENDSVTGYGGYVHEAHIPTGHFTAWVIVDPDCRGRRLARLYRIVVERPGGKGSIQGLYSDMLDNNVEPGLCPALRFRHRPAYLQLRAGSGHL